MGRIIVVDTETSGLAVRNGGRVIEVGAVAVEDGQVVDELSTLIDTGTPICYSAWRVHGISADMLAGKPTPEEVWPQFREFVGESLLVAHNAPFDRTFILHEMGRLAMRLPNPWRCTVSLARKLLPYLPDHRLDTVHQHLFGPLPPEINRHRALDDARMAARIWMKLGGGCR